MQDRVLSPQPTPARPWLLGGLVLIMIAAPLYRAGQPPVPLMMLELAGIALLLMALWRPPALARAEWIALGLLALLPLLYLVPLSLEWVVDLPGRAPYIDAWRAALTDERMPDSARLSLVPGATAAAWLVLAIPIGVFLGVRALPADRLPVLASVLLAVAAAEAALGLMQFGAGRESPLYLGMDYTHFESAVGTYTNRNHLGGLMEMALPIALALLFSAAGRGRNRHRDLRTRAAFLGSVRGQEALIYGALTVLLLVGVVFSRSRMAIAMTILGILLSLTLFSRRIGGSNAFGPVGTLVAVALGLAVTIGLLPVLDRFSAEGVIDDNRWMLFDRTLVGIGSFFPLGSGPGTYGDIFPAFQSAELGRWFVNRAHNDYLEWVFEGGLPALFLIFGLLGLYLAQWRRVWTPGEWPRLRFLQIGAGIGIALILLHELVDYNLHIPANMVYFAVLCGIFFSDPEAATSTESAPVLRAADNDARQRSRAPQLAAERRAPVGQIKNPFLDD